MAPGSFDGIRFQRDRRVLPDLVDPGALLAHISSPSFDLVVADRATPSAAQPEFLPRGDDDGESAQTALVSDGLYAFEVVRGGKDHDTTMLTSPAEVVRAFVAWADGAPGWEAAYAWD